MESKDDLPECDLVVKYVYLPNGQEVVVEIVDKDRMALVRRVGGERHGTVAVCAVTSLGHTEPLESRSDNDQWV